MNIAYLRKVINPCPGFLLTREQTEEMQKAVESLIAEYEEAQGAVTILQHALAEKAEDIAAHIRELSGEGESRCSFCGQVSGHDVAAIQEHMLNCDKHPLRLAAEDAEKLAGLLRKMRTQGVEGHLLVSIDLALYLHNQYKEACYAHPVG